VGEAGGLAADDAQPGAAVASRNELLDAAVVEATTRRAAVLDEDLGEVAAASQCLVERVLEKLVIDHLAYRKRMSLGPGLSASVSLVVEETDTALAMGSGDVPVLATPRVIALAEQASVEAVADELKPGATTVGYEVQLAHLAPTPVGGKVTAEAILESIEGRRLTFRVSVSDARGLVAAGRITRVIVMRDRFVERAQAES
jgi:fluoroacetyl-CoA thioesterase